MDLAMSIWEHPQLGRFTAGEYGGWHREVMLPAFAKFKDSTGTIDLVIDVDEDDQPPADGAVDVALKTIANCAALVPMGLRMLFDDLAGNGPDSGMWWHNDLQHIAEILKNHPPAKAPKEPDDLLSLLSSPSILVMEAGYGYDDACSILGFESPIDVEHGIGLLTDGTKIVGLGYRSDPSPFGE